MTSRSISVMFYVATLLCVACQRESAAPPQPQKAAGSPKVTAAPPADISNVKVDTIVPLPPNVVPQCSAGSVLDPNGAVSQAKTTFAKTDPIHFSMWLNEAPPGLQVSVKVIDEDNEEVSIAKKAAEGVTIATLRIATPARAGKYRLEGYWGGNLVCEKAIEITQ